MPLNLLKKYNELLEFSHLNEDKLKISLYGVFKRDFIDSTFLKFKTKKINPTPLNGKIDMNNLFSHLTTKMEDEKSKKRIFDKTRSQRLHWVKFHIDELKKEGMLTFSVEEPQGFRTYIYDKTEMYVIILEPLRNKNEYYLLTAYHLIGKDAKRNKILKKYERKLNDIL